MGRIQPCSHLPRTQSISLRALDTGGLCSQPRGEDSLPSRPFGGRAGTSFSMAAGGSWRAQSLCWAPSTGDRVWKGHCSHCSWFEQCHSHPRHAGSSDSRRSRTHGKHCWGTQGRSSYICQLWVQNLPLEPLALWATDIPTAVTAISSTSLL